MHGQTRLSINNNDVNFYRVGSHWVAQVANTNKTYEGFASKKAAIAILTDLLPYVSKRDELEVTNALSFEEELRAITQQYEREKRAKEAREAFITNDQILSQYDEVDVFAQVALVLRAIGNYTIAASDDNDARDRMLQHLEELTQDDGLTSDFALLLFDALDFAVTKGLGWDAPTTIHFGDRRLAGFDPQSHEFVKQAEAIASKNIFTIVRKYPNLVKACDNYAQAHRCRLHRIWEV
jgi:hypothetical protein